MKTYNKRVSFFKRHLLISILGTFVLVILALGTHFLIMQSGREMRYIPNFGADAVASLSQKMPVEEAFTLIFMHGGTPHRQALLLDENSKVLLRTDEISEEQISQLHLSPELLAQNNRKSQAISQKDSWGPFSPLLTRLSENPPRFLLSFPPRMGFVDKKGTNRGPPSIWGPIVLVFGVSLSAVLLSFAILVIYLQRNSASIEGVIFELRSGNLKARFNVKKLDEVGQLMTKFNEMADEIESLVERIRGAERNRIQLVQELGHDFRTPLASLKNCLETLRYVKSGSNEQLELMTYSVSEVDYLTRLTDNLLFLARVDDPKYLKQGKMIRLSQFLVAEVEKVRHSRKGDTVHLNVRNNLSEDFLFYGDKHLLSRLLRNALENSFEHAKSNINLSFDVDDKNKKFVLEISNDGPGFSPELLTHYGQKRVSRAFEESQGKKISLGLGSVIIRAVTQAHQGTLLVENLHSEKQESGVILKIELPVRVADVE